MTEAIVIGNSDNGIAKRFLTGARRAAHNFRGGTVDWAPAPALSRFSAGPAPASDKRSMTEASQQGRYRIGIDTGAVYGGALTALRLPDESVFQVP